jgi:hypothetical protein
LFGSGVHLRRAYFGIRRCCRTQKVHMLEFAPIVARPTLLNAGHKKKRRILPIANVNTYTPYPMVLIPIGKDGSVNHAVCLVDDLIFDSPLTHALKCKLEVLDWICTGENGECVGIQQFPSNSCNLLVASHCNVLWMTIGRNDRRLTQL